MAVIHWRCPKIYVDESLVTIRGKGELLLVGCLFCPPGSPLESRLEDARNRLECVELIQSSRIKGTKQTKLALEFVNLFMQSKARYRAIVFPKIKEKFNIFCDGKMWKMFVKALKLVLSHSYISKTHDVRIIKPKLIIERNSSYGANYEDIRDEIVQTLLVNDLYGDMKVFKVKHSPVVSLADKEVSECLQLTDTLLSLVKWDIQNPRGIKKKTFWTQCKRLIGVRRPLEADNRFTKYKFNVWKFHGCDQILNK